MKDRRYLSTFDFPPPQVYIYMYNKFYRIYKFVQRSIDIRMPPTAINNSKKNQNSHLIEVDW